jgi:hypothetical protein
MSWTNLREELNEEFATLSWRIADIVCALECRHSVLRGRVQEARELNGAARCDRRIYYAGKRCDPAWVARRREYDRCYYQRHKQDVLAKAKVYRSRMSADAMERKRAYVRAYSFARYHRDPVYRAKSIARSKATAKARHQRIKADPKRYARAKATWRRAYERSRAKVVAVKKAA